jgi:hypothetical protein
MRQVQTQQQDHRSSVEILRDARRETTRTIEVAQDTNESLARQGEQIDRIHGKVDKIEAELTVSDKILKSMTGWTGLVTSIFSSTKKERPEPKPAEPAPKPAREVPAPAGSRHARSPPPDVAQKPATGGLTEDEVSELDGLASDLGQIKQMAMAQNTTIRQQNERLDSLNKKTAQANAHMERTRNRVDRVS